MFLHAAWLRRFSLLPGTLLATLLSPRLTPLINLMTIVTMSLLDNSKRSCTSNWEDCKESRALRIFVPRPNNAHRGLIVAITRPALTLPFPHTRIVRYSQDIICASCWNLPVEHSHVQAYADGSFDSLENSISIDCVFVACIRRIYMCTDPGKSQCPSVWM